MSNNPNVTVFLSLCSEEQSALRNELSSVLQRAGMTVVTDQTHFTSDSLPLITEQLSGSNCSIHILFPEYQPLTDTGVSVSKFQFLEAKKYLLLNPDFKIFVWQPPSIDLLNIESLQMDFINEVKNNISKSMVYSNVV
ncbi:MAG: hypothetical protein K8R85_10280, partial [Bacteroidetes bacterium]|nr:hypothetical protein [Bacteroidota bacterium]